MKKNTSENWRCRFLVLLSISALILTSTSGCVKERVNGAAYGPTTTDLSISKPPALGQTAELTVTLLAAFNASNFSVSILLPEGLEFVSGDLSWQDEVIEDESIQFKAVVKAVKTGTWLVRALPQIGGGDQFYLLISEDSAKVSKNPFPTNRSKKMAVPMSVDLSIVGTPSLNQPVELTFTVTPLINAPNTTVQALLPEGFSLVSGDLSWNGDIAKNETFQLKTSVKAVETGYWTIKASAKSIKSDQIVFGKTDKIYINVSESTAIVSESPLQNYSRSNRTMTTQLPSNFTRPLVNETSEETLLTPSPTQPES